MLLELRKIMDLPGGSIPFEASLDLSDMTFGSCKPVTEPVLAAGQVRNTAGVLEMKGSLRTTLHGICDRCAGSFQREVEYPIDAVLVSGHESENSDNPWEFDLTDDCADLDEILTTVFVLNMSSKMLCKEDCKGLCPRCGTNLNFGACSCKPESDPRLAVLQQLLDRM